ncbi:uncharacterized protein VNE69_06123 [Vairimorpha necatrix]|uniref:Uncharacterized protein n=1 Tax=Vairimorpha necatrix TaxID=6039 RepID=A0AAX4JD51_9MICR
MLKKYEENNNENKNKDLKTTDENNDDDSLDMILNPHVYALDDTLKSIHSSSSTDEKNQLIDELTVIFTKDDILFNRKIQARFPDILNLLKNPDLYNNSCILISDMVRHKPIIQEIFFLLKIFDFLNFEKYKNTMSLVFSMCYGNKKLTEYYFTEIFKEERDNENELVKILKEQK